MTALDRREFLKLAGLSAAGLAMPRGLATPGHLRQSEKPNVLVAVYDAFSYHHISLYGYARNTTPNIDRLANKATVYHNHRATANFTSPGTASLLTGTHPWAHRATNSNGSVSDAFVDRSVFHALNGYHRMSYSHNLWANTILDQFAGGIDEKTPWQDLYLRSDAFLGEIFSKDSDIATLSWIRAMKPLEDGTRYSTFLSALYRAYQEGRFEAVKKEFPRGLPSVNLDNYFILEDATDHLIRRVADVPQPYFAYYHFLPPHSPYYTRKEFFGTFAGDGYQPPEKPRHPFSGGKSPEELLLRRTDYDEYIRYVDVEFARLYDALERSGALENTWLVLTSDHGEIFERGLSGHGHSSLFDPVVHVPLLIFAPGQNERMDIEVNTSAVDMLPTLMHLTGHPIPDWAEGRVLPPFDPGVGPRDIYALQAIGAGHEKPLEKATAMLLRESYKLSYFFGYADLGGDREYIELYDLENDPDELHNLARQRPALRDDLLADLKAKIVEVNEPFNT
jgi:arylsulfatase A-like enzyme